eukprot:5488634-Pleurochrysis_carterae.AAC.1
MLAFGAADSLPAVLLCRAMQGATAGGVAVGKVYLADITDASNEALVFACIGLSIGAGSFIGPLLGGLLAQPEDVFPGIRDSQVPVARLLRRH